MNPDRWIAGGTALISGQPRRDLAVRVEQGKIAAIASQATATGDVEWLQDGQYLLPGLIDVQVNGGGGILFNDAPENLTEIVAAHRSLGVSAILPTLVTDAPALLERAARAVLNYTGEGVLGLHLEGPFISPARPGIHAPRFIRRMRTADVALLADLAQRLAPRKLLLTLAPEEVEDSHLEALAAAGVVMSIGHSVASYQRCIQALNLGVRGFTHLWNAMPGPTARAPGPVVAAFEQGFAGIIADFIHVDRANLRLTLAAKAPGTLFLVSDAMSVAGTALQEITLQGRKISRFDGKMASEDGTLAGADLDLRHAVQNMADGLGLPLWQAWSMGSEVPAAFLGLLDVGRIAVGCRADLVVI